MTDIPAPVPVTELIAQRPPEGPHANDDHLSYGEVVRAWPVVGNVGEVVRANGVRTNAHTGGTYGNLNWTEYHAGDVQQVADAIAGGTAVLQPNWRRDTEEGREARRQWYERLRRENRARAVDPERDRAEPAVVRRGGVVPGGSRLLADEVATWL